VGDRIMLQIVASGCQPGGHVGYVLVDAPMTTTFQAVWRDYDIELPSASAGLGAALRE
jgi:hypothetical protein